MVVVFYDLETTSLRKDSEIIAIGAVTPRGCEFDEYIKPTIDVHPRATEKNGLRLCRDRNALVNANNGKIIPSSDRATGLLKFINHLKKVSTNGENEIILVAHNNFQFDSIVLENNLKELGTSLSGLDIKMADSIDVMVQLQKTKVVDFPYGKSLDKCLTVLLDRSQREPHDALGDANDCKDITLEAVSRMGYRNRYQAKINQYFEDNPELLRNFSDRNSDTDSSCS